MKYFSEVEGKARSRSLDEIGDVVWGGIATMIQKLMEDGSFGSSFPSQCPDGAGVEGTDASKFFRTLRAEVPDISDELEVGRGNQYVLNGDSPPDTTVALDLIQFCFEHVAKPLERDYHSFFKHHHLGFDQESGRTDFRQRVNRMFSRNGIVFDLEADGSIRRRIPQEMKDVYEGSFLTPDASFNKLMQEAMDSFRAPERSERERGVEKLWDAWERLKSLQSGDKKASTAELLDRAARGNTQLRKVIEDEALALTRIGNDFRIRHHEVGKVALAEGAHLEYVFYRMLSLISLLVPRAG